MDYEFWTEASDDFDGFIRNKNPLEREVVVPRRRGMKKMTDDIHTGMRASSGKKAHRAGTELLVELGFDPLEELIKQLKEIEQLIELESLKNRPSATQLSKLQNLKKDIIQAILPYRYGKAPLTTILDVDREAPLRIILTNEDEDEEAH
jgi:hypothetical protein